MDPEQARRLSMLSAQANGRRRTTMNQYQFEMQFLEATLSTFDLSGQNQTKSLAGLHDIKPEVGDDDDSDLSDWNPETTGLATILQKHALVIYFLIFLLKTLIYYTIDMVIEWYL